MNRFEYNKCMETRPDVDTTEWERKVPTSSKYVVLLGGVLENEEVMVIMKEPIFEIKSKFFLELIFLWIEITYRIQTNTWSTPLLENFQSRFKCLRDPISVSDMRVASFLVSS